MLLKYKYKNKIEVGCDEAGRGCLAGPVTGAAVLLPKKFNHKLLDDSKKMTEKNRNELRQIIEEKALAYAVTQVSHSEIDEINILNASIQAMQLSLAKIELPFNYILIDGNRFKSFKDIPHECIIKGDGQFMSIAAASVLAKTYRDEYMEILDEAFPMYGWRQNKGYPTLAHREAIEKYGPSPFHRMSFNLLGDRQMKLF